MAKYVEVSIGNERALIEIDSDGDGIVSSGSFDSWVSALSTLTTSLSEKLSRQQNAELEFGVSMHKSGKLTVVSREKAVFMVRIGKSMPLSIPTPPDTV